MKILVAADIHGSAYYTEKLLARMEEEKVDKLVLLGDIFYHGPRNPLPKGYEPMKVAEVLNKIADKLIVVKGNCDAEVDQMISRFSFVENAILLVDGKVIYLTHGHKENEENIPKTKLDVLIYGHFHMGFLKKKGEILIGNPGSISLPKNDTKNSYMVIEENWYKLKDIEGNLIEKIKLDD